MKKVACRVLALTTVIFIMNPAYGEASGRHGDGHGGWWVPWAIIGGAAILTSHLARYSAPPPVIIREQTPVPVPPASSFMTAPEERVFIYPRQGQREALQARDRYECHLWAVNQTGCDPMQPSAGSIPEEKLDQIRADYLRAQATCLDGRGYTMR